MGLPKIGKDGPKCSGLADTKPCTEEALISGMSKRPPVFAAQDSPAYSNVAYSLLGMVVEAATGEKFVDYVDENIWKVAGMKSTSFNGFVDAFEDNGSVPATGDPTWNRTLGSFEPSGGMF